ncbi:hydrogenase nickel incorporation protein HypB [Paractinoplanes globisporus]|uniref:Hydrogenase nickel incorporation protein HypB n=1 Tax=Paractinoplanes globisporus TaxID=113565 RepID=A0ABW6WCW3_9ACTN|nr:hydrogenase nickel incorporation protein HypB [Actinoplanes globisporus]
MCATCGCGHTHDHHHEEITLEQKVLAKNDELAATNRAFLESREITAVNLMSSPGSGKTTLLERTIRDLAAAARPVAVVEGDQETRLDAERISRTGCPVVQVNTGAGCHLDAAMLRDAIDRLRPERRALLFVENVGNLVCPALFDLGERGRVVIISVTEGTDKPLKYPYIFAAADLVVVNKVDLLPYVDFDLGACRAHVASVNPKAEVLALSATRGDNIETWYQWLGAN